MPAWFVCRRLAYQVGPTPGNQMTTKLSIQISIDGNPAWAANMDPGIILEMARWADKSPQGKVHQPQEMQVLSKLLREWGEYAILNP